MRRSAPTPGRLPCVIEQAAIARQRRRSTCLPGWLTKSRGCQKAPIPISRVREGRTRFEPETGWWRKQSCETGLQRGNREFSENLGPKQALRALTAAGYWKFQFGLRQLRGPPG